MTFILVVAIHVLLKIKFIVSSFPGGEGNKGMITSLYWTETTSHFEQLIILCFK